MIQKDIKRGMIFIQAFLFLTTALGIAASILFFGVRTLFRDNPYRSVFRLSMGFRGINFSGADSEPALYILSIVLISSLLGAIWITLIAPKFSNRVRSHIFLLPWISLIITSPIFGLLYSIYLRKPADFLELYPTNSKDVMWLFYKTDALSGLKLGWLAAIQSFPINILSYIAFCSILLACYRLFSTGDNIDDSGHA